MDTKLLRKSLTRRARNTLQGGHEAPWQFPFDLIFLTNHSPSEARFILFFGAALAALWD
jgi:hypothetical protein